MPVTQVITPPVTPLVGAEQIIISFIYYNDRIGGRPVFAPFGKIRYGRIAIIDVHGIAIRAIARRWIVGKPCRQLAKRPTLIILALREHLRNYCRNIKNDINKFLKHGKL
jgi:hypothetical protein